MYGITKTGFVSKRLDVIRQEAISKIRGLYSDALVTDETIEGNFVNIFSTLAHDLWEAIHEVYRSSHPQFAENASQDSLYELNNIRRRKATFSRLPRVRITATPYTVVPAGFRAYSTVKPDVIFQTLSEITIPDSGFAFADMFCMKTGPHEIPISSLDTILTPVSGVTSVENTQSTVIGRDLESDAQFRIRRENEIANSVGGTESGIYNALTALNEDETFRVIEFIKVISNRTLFTDAAGRPGKSFEAIVYDAAAYESPVSETCTATQGSDEIVVNTDLTGYFLPGDIIAIDSNYNSFGKEKFTIKEMNFVSPSTTVKLCAEYKGSTGSREIYKVDGKDKDIAAAIWKSQSAGIETHGFINILTKNIEGQDELIRYSHPAPVHIHLKLTLTSITSPLTAEEKEYLVKNIVDWGNSLGIGNDVIVFGYNCLAGQINNNKIKNISINLGYSAPGGSVNWVGANNVNISDGTTQEVQFSVWDVSRVEIL